MRKDARKESLPGWAWAAMAAALLGALLLSACLGSVRVPLRETVAAIARALKKGTDAPGAFDAILLSVRLPRVLCAGLTGAALSLSGAAMQGLLRNPLADGSTLGVSSGAALGAVTALLLGLSVPGLPWSGTAVFAMLFALLSLLAILALSYRFDAALSTNTLILVGVVFGMFCSSILSLLITFAGERLRTILFWTMGSLAGSTWQDALLLACSLLLFGGMLLGLSRELNAFAVGEENAAHVGVAVRRVKLLVLAASAGLIGVSVSTGGCIGFVGLVVPHAARLFTGPNHKKLLPVSAFFGAIFLTLSDLVCRTALSPRELPIGVMTSFIGSVAFLLILRRAGRGRT